MEKQAQLIERQKQVEANKAAIAAKTARFGPRDDHYIGDEVTVLFGNGQVKVDPSTNRNCWRSQIRCRRLMATVIDVKGYACSAGRAAVNQKLSADRADNITNIQLPKGQVYPDARREQWAKPTGSGTIKLPTHKRRMNEAIAGTPPFVIIP